MTAAKIAAGAFNLSAFTGAAAAGACTLASALVGDTVAGIVDITDGTDLAADFEATISVAGQIQQSSATDLHLKKFAILLLKTGS